MGWGDIQLLRCHGCLRVNYSINHPEDTGAWEQMTAIKQDILRKWDSFPYPVKICCIKFAQRVVQVQTHGMISDPRVCFQAFYVSRKKPMLTTSATRAKRNLPSHCAQKSLHLSPPALGSRGIWSSRSFVVCLSGRSKVCSVFHMLNPY